MLIWYFFYSCQPNHPSGIINFRGLSAKEVELAYDYIDKIKRSNKLFSLILDELYESDIQLTVEFSKKVKIGGFLPKKGNSYQLYFKSLDEFCDENAILEEFFHAFQAKFYGIETMFPDDEGVISGAVNLEYEAKLLKALSAFHHDKAFFETPSQKGLLDFVMSLLDGSGKLKVFGLNSILHRQYIELVSYFQKH